MSKSGSAAVPPRKRGKGGTSRPRPVAPRPPAARASNTKPGGNARIQQNRAAIAAQKRKRNMFLGAGAIAVVIIVVVVLVLVKVTGGGKTATKQLAGTTVAVSDLQRLQTVPMATLNQGNAKLVTAVQSINDAPLSATKPELLYIGALFCPYCAAERWVMYVALSKFGTFTPEPGQLLSSEDKIWTFSFYGTKYSSPYLTFTSVENGDQNGKTLEKTTAAQQKIWINHTKSGSYPFIDFNGKQMLTTSQYDPQSIENQSFDAILNDVGDNSSTIGNNIDTSAAVFIKALCVMTGQKPANVCSSTGH